MQKNSRPAIVFFGTPDFAVASLATLLKYDYPVLAVITAPDKPAGRGRKLQVSAVKELALQYEIPVLQPEKLKSPDFLARLKELNADLHIVVAFRMLPEAVWNMPPMGTINVHASLLPQYRGAAPINHAIINGETVTGVTTFQLKHEIDTGDLLLQKEIPILPEDNFGTLYHKLMEAGAELLTETLKQLQEGNIRPVKQNIQATLHQAPKIFREDCEINWQRPAKKIHDFIRGLSPSPAAFTFIQDKKIKVLKANYELAIHTAEIGSMQTDHKNYLKMAASDGWVSILSLQPEGKKVMDIRSFLNGHKF